MSEKKVKKNLSKINQSKTGKSEHEKINDVIVKEIVSMNHGQAGNALVRPNMAMLMIGEDSTAVDFFESLEQEAVKVGIDTHSYKCPIDSDQEEIKAMIDCLNDDDLIDGIYLQLPLPDGFNEEEILALIKTDKDLNYILESGIDDEFLSQAKLFQGVMDNFKNRRVERL